MPPAREPVPGADPDHATLTVRRRADGTTTVVSLVGELDIATFPLAERAVREAEAGSPAALRLDLSGLWFVDSTGVRLVLAADERARESGRRCSVTLGSGRSRRLFEVLGLLDRLDIVSPEGA